MAEKLAAGVMAVDLPLPQNNDKKKMVPHNDDNNNNNNNNNNGIPKKRKRSANILKVALMLLRRRSAKSTAADVASKGMWKRLVGAMRPLHLQSDDNNQLPDDDQQIPPSSDPLPLLLPPPLHSSPSLDNFQDVFSPPFSPNIPKSSSSSSIDGMSRYASAINLEELDQNDDNDEDENDNNGEANANMNSGDEMIDAKAEVFIAQFYEQMRLQRSDSDIRYNEMIKRSIG